MKKFTYYPSNYRKLEKEAKDAQTKAERAHQDAVTLLKKLRAAQAKLEKQKGNGKVSRAVRWLT